MGVVDKVDTVVKRIEATEALDRVGKPLAAAISRATRPTLVKNALSGTWLGHQLHPLLTDVPIGSWVRERSSMARCAVRGMAASSGFATARHFAVRPPLLSPPGRYAWKKGACWSARRGAEPLRQARASVYDGNYAPYAGA